MRWQEEVTLTTYEMQWTMRYFVNQCKNWFNIQETLAKGITSIASGGAGALAYAKHKHSTWHQLSVKLDRTFTVINNAYKSPL